MKKISRIKLFTFTAILLVFTLQGIWLYRAYKETEAKLELVMNDDFALAVEQEFMNRFKSFEKAPVVPGSGVTQPDEDVLFDSGKDTLSNENPGEDFAIIIQEYLYYHKIYISLDTISTHFSNLLAANNIHGKFVINRVNSTSGELLESTGENHDGRLKGALYSNIIPIRIDKSEGVQAVLIAPHRAVFLQMAVVLILSVLLILFVAYALFYQMSSFLKEKQLRQLHTDFSHALTHDMATPLQTLTQVNNLLMNEKLYNDPVKRAKYIDVAREQLLNLQALTDRILTVAKAQKSTLEVNLSAVDLRKLMVSLTDKFSIQTKKPVEFVLSFLPDPVIMQADTTLLSNAVGNLIDNAIKYSGSAVKISLRCEEKENGVYIYIADNGYGISEKDQKKVFTMFERGKAVTRKEAKGFGLGLSYVKTVVEAHGGAITLYSKEGAGSEFVLLFPRAITS